MRSWTPLALLCVVGLTAAACSDDPQATEQIGQDQGPIDEGVVPVADAEVDAVFPDLGPLPPLPDEGLPPDGPTPDAAVLDAAVQPDLALPDAAPACVPAAERCDGVDNDCDEATDEGYRVGEVCGIGTGACRAVGEQVCSGDGDTTMCPLDPGPPADEQCNGVDDDCDGRTDEDFDVDGDLVPNCGFEVCDLEVCPFGDPEACRVLCDVQDCRDEDRSVSPTRDDVCGDGIDQNCDGQDAPCSVAVGRVDSLAMAGAAAMAVGCPDVNGDGQPDNAFGPLAPLVNDALSMSVADGTLNLFLGAAGLAPPGTDGAFTLIVLAATAVEGGGYAVDPAALDESGAPRIALPGARVRGGALRAGPGVLSLALPVLGADLTLTLRQALVQGSMGVDESLGFSLADGLLWGAVRQDELQAALAQVSAACDMAMPRPDSCDLLAMAAGLLDVLLRLDQDLDRDGQNESYSVCLRVTANPEVLAGYPVER